MLLIPLIISSNKTPKLYTSDFSEKNPFIAYSGDMYPLYLEKDLLSIEIKLFIAMSRNSKI